MIVYMMNETNTTPAANPMQVAETILEQLGGRRFIVMTGARGFTGSANALTFKLPRAGRGVKAVRIELTPADLYDVTFYAGRDYRVIELQTGIYADQLRVIFTAVTGLETSL